MSERTTPEHPDSNGELGRRFFSKGSDRLAAGSEAKRFPFPFGQEDSRQEGIPRDPSSWRENKGAESFAFPGGGGPYNDHLGQFVYQEHNSFFRSRMPKSTHWSIVWSDLMMTMFIVFVVLFVYFSVSPKLLRSQEVGSELGSAVGAGKLGHGGGGGLGEQAEPAQEALDKIFRLSRQAVLKENLGEFASVDMAPDRSVRIVLTGDLLFDSGKADLKREASKDLAKIAAVLRKSPLMVNVVGHTDDMPIHSKLYPSNWELSLARAGVVARFLIEEMGLPAKRFYVSGYAANRPVRRNDTPENRAANRRVEIVVTKNLPDAMVSREPIKMIRYAGRDDAI